MSRPTVPLIQDDGTPSVVRTVTGVIAADSATLTDANFPFVHDPLTPGIFSTINYETIWVCVQIAGGAGPTATIELLFRDDPNPPTYTASSSDAPDGQRWKRLAAADSGALDGSAWAELRVDGDQFVFPRIKAVANSGSTTSIKILVKGGKRRGQIFATGVR